MDLMEFLGGWSTGEFSLRWRFLAGSPLRARHIGNPNDPLEDDAPVCTDDFRPNLFECGLKASSIPPKMLFCLQWEMETLV